MLDITKVNEVITDDDWESLRQKKVIIAGLSQYGRAIYRKMNRLGFRPTHFVDNDKGKVGQEWAGVPVLAPEDLRKTDFDFILLAGRYIAEVYSQLILELKLDPNKICFPRKSSYAAEERDIQKRERWAVEALRQVIKFLDENGIEYWIDASSLLALTRNQRLAELADIDISILNITDLDRLRKQRFGEIRRQDLTRDRTCEFWAKGDSFGIEMYYNTASIIFIEPVKIDLVHHSLDDNSVVKSWKEKIFKIPMELILPFETIEYHGMCLKVPAKREDYLEKMYGKTWRTPAQLFQGPNP